ncbi:MAG: PKD domain-containing protein [Candidatus Thermoplasmatota archaeon]|nr:PKD domain-containing protein [Candidatus Thermoplasmatota archaeon]
MNTVKMAVATMICMMTLSVVLVIDPTKVEGKDGSFGGETGTPEDPFIIEDVRDLQNIENNLSAHYVLGNDIDASVTSSWNAGAGFEPIGTWQDPFVGILDGRNFTITDLSINRPSTDYAGIFGYLGTSYPIKGMLKNLALVDCVITGKDYVGGLVGKSNAALISNCHVSGAVRGINRVGGLVGFDQGSIYDSHSSASINAEYYGGGLVGYDQGQVYNCYSTGDVNAVSFAGGLFGYHWRINSNSHYNVEEVSINGGHHLTTGGLFDDQYQDWMSNGLSLDISDYSSTLVPSGGYYLISNAQGFRDILGFADVNDYRYRLSADIDLSGNPGLYIPHFSGSEFDGDNHTIYNLRLDLDFVVNVGMFGNVLSGVIRNLDLVDVDLNGRGSVGGLIGSMGRVTVSFCSTSGEVASGGSAGGLIGSENTGEIFDCYSTCDVNGNGSVGGLVGMTHGGSVYNCHATGNIDGGFWRIGGLIGTSTITAVANCSATGNVRGTDDYVGGLMGMNEGGRVSGCYATGTVSGDRWGIGGLIGDNDGGIVSDCYANGNVVGIDNAVGGLIGDNTGAAYNCYSTGNVSGSGTYFGGLVGYQFGTVSDCFWDVESSGRTSSYGGTGKTTTEMMTMSTFTDAGWDLDGIWHIVEDETYPFFRWQDAGAPVANAGPEQIVYLGQDGEATVSFEGTESYDDFGIFSYTWAFIHQGMEVLLYGKKVEYVFRAPDLYDVTLKVTDASGNQGVDIMQVAILDQIPPVADAGSDQVVDEGTYVTFDGSGSSDNVGIVGYKWTFTDGGPVSLEGIAPGHDFNNPGSFIVTLKVTDASDNSDTDTMTVTVNDITSPVADAGEDVIVEEGAVVIFNGSESHDNVGIANWTWTFFDGENITLYDVQPLYRFNTTGLYIVTLNVTDEAGYWNTDTMNVTVVDITPPIADAGPDQVVDQGTLVIFNGSGSSDNVGITNWTWTFTDGGKITLQGSGPSYLFEHPGVFIVTLNVTDVAGNWQIDTMTVTVRDITPPVANAGEDRTVPAGTTVSFDGSLSIDNVGITSYIWTLDYNDEGQTLLGEEVTFTFVKGGTYEVLLTVSDGSGNTDQDSVMIYVIDKGTVSGTVLDDEEQPVEGALVEITASDGNVYSATTGSDGSFSLEVPYGPFAWKISKDGYETISGTGTVAAMGDADIDLSGEPMVREKEDGKDSNLLLWILIVIILIAIVVLYFLMRSKKTKDWGEE